MALNGVLGLHDSTESNLRALFGEDVGVAFLILGQLKLYHRQMDEAATCFRSALKYNPLLWSAFSQLCDLEKEVSPEDWFKVTEYPGFLRPRPLLEGSGPPPVFTGGQALGTLQRGVEESTPTQYHTPTGGPPDDVAIDDEICAESALFKSGGESAFKPVKPAIDKKKPVYVTPCIFHESVGSAIASSTPARRDFGRPPNTASAVPVGGARGKGLGRLTGGRGGVSSIRHALDYSSSSTVKKMVDAQTPDSVGVRTNPR